MLTDRHHIEAYLKKLGIESGYSIRHIDNQALVDVHSEASIVYEEPLRVKFGRVEGHFSIKSNSTMPVNDVILSFVGFPHTITGCFSLFGSDFKNMSGVEREVKFVGQEIVLNPDATHILGMLMIGGSGNFDVDRGTTDTIMNKYRNSQDILSAQDELLDAGLKDAARF